MKTSILATILAFTSIALTAPVETCPPEDAHKLFRRESCSNSSRCSQTDAFDAMNAFINRGTENCGTPTRGEYGIIWQNGPGCTIWAHAIDADSASSFCRDVGYGIRNIINSCQSDGKVGGNGAAGGNGNFGLTITGNQ